MLHSGTSLYLILGLVVARFAAIGTVVLAVVGEANTIVRVAKRAILQATAAFFRLITNQTVELLIGHQTHASSVRDKPPFLVHCPRLKGQNQSGI
jgi:hypothetical protein